MSGLARYALGAAKADVGSASPKSVRVLRPVEVFIRRPAIIDPGPGGSEGVLSAELA
jgi:hypothetical protein